ncbi:MAG TPA: DUF4197 domain-containing protein [Methylophaga aminisulfidivorans]|uniref:DUF4197 domain-containing protein n=1 Tax=Methylophaga aminisulfidivorans TaxID=230105 RepID=A0A7C1VVV3_9GAMM|nr:DUF4197 domain-containing protein [Methylophaga aminisulfidivorans]
MTRKAIFFVSILLLAMNTNTAHADWGSVLDKLKEDGKTLLDKSSTSSTANEELNIDTITSGLKEALIVGSKKAIAEVSKSGGYLDNAKIRIPLPPQVEKAGSLMRQFGMSSLADNFETSMNRAAEKAAPKAADILIEAIKNMSISDARDILKGSDDAATKYFQQHTSDKLRSLFKPTIDETLDEVGSTRYYNELSDKVSDIPVVGQNLNVNLPDYVTEQALNGLFTMLASEEKKIRENPASRTTELLKSVFSNQ